MGSSWNERRRDEDERGLDHAGPLSERPGLAAAELDLLRHAPDYDAEEMASVRPAGGYPLPGPASFTPSGEAASPAPPPWLPPNRIEPPAAAAPAVPIRPTPPAGFHARFPEERTVALLAEDLLGRPLDEPAGVRSQSAPGEPAFRPSGVRAAGGAATVTTRARAGSGAEVWDAAMPLWAEG